MSRAAEVRSFTSAAALNTGPFMAVQPPVKAHDQDKVSLDNRAGVSLIIIS
jgi:hypothetical protein